MATAGGSAPAIVMKGNAGAAEHDGGLANSGALRADVHALEKLLAKATGDAKEKLTEQVTELYLKVKGYSLADARPGAQCVARRPRPTRAPRCSPCALSLLTEHAPPRARHPLLRPARTQLVAETKAVLAEAKKAFPALE